jgi:hypothetical protein
MPFLGLATDEAIMESLPRLRGMELFYSELSILEAMWKIAKVVKKEDLSVVMEGLSLLNKLVELTWSWTA